jgi:hypothetical protein
MATVCWPAMHAPRPWFAAALLSLCAWGARAPAQESQTQVMRVGPAIHFTGRIDEPAARRFLELLADPQVDRLVITSNGGQVLAALRMAEAMHARGIDIEVPTSCKSSCANYLFPAGRRKVLGWPGAVAWHGNMTHVLYLQQMGQASWSETVMAGARELAGREKALFQRLGVDGFVCWFAKLPPYAVEDFYYLQAQDMERFGITQVTVQSPAGPEPAGQLRLVLVDWPALETLRPQVAVR